MKPERHHLTDGYVSANQTGYVYAKALKENNVDIIENFELGIIIKMINMSYYPNHGKKINANKIQTAGVYLEKVLKCNKYKY